jgi:adenosylcobyric acid synthase
MAQALMLQGTGSDVGKSLLLTGIARALTRRGLRVLPFKPQNMSNNAAVTIDGGEIGRAQAVQALACGTVPVTDMNPVLLKPQSEGAAQIVVDGRVWGCAAATDYRRLAPTLLPRVLGAFGRLAAAADLVLVEGAGSPAEINLRAGDIANMGFAEAAHVPVVLVGDIERGGVIAQLVGTYALLSDSERALLAGYIINKFRGDVRLFDGGLAAIGERTGLRDFGVVPFFPDAALLPAEDSLALARLWRNHHPQQPLSARLRGEREGPAPQAREDEVDIGARRGIPHLTPPSPPPGAERSQNSGNPRRFERVRIAVPVLPRIANFDDLDPLVAEPAVDVEFVRPGRPLPRDATLVIMPGSKATIADLAFLRDEGWDIDLLAHRRHGGQILGLCGGYQMLGHSIADPLGREGPPSEIRGLGLLDIDTVLDAEKRLGRAAAVDLASGALVDGYEMHLGRTTGPGLARPMLRLGDRPEGAVSADGLVAGCYLHGLFTGDDFRAAFLRRLGAAAGDIAYSQRVETTLDALAVHLERNLDLPAILAAARPPRFR